MIIQGSSTFRCHLHSALAQLKSRLSIAEIRRNWVAASLLLNLGNLFDNHLLLYRINLLYHFFRHGQSNGIVSCYGGSVQDRHITETLKQMLLGKDSAFEDSSIRALH